MNISLRKVWVLTKMKLHNLYINQMVIASFFIPIIVALGGFLVYKKFLGGITLDSQNILLINASLINVIYLGIFVPAVLMAEEKEKNTLRVLMVSSVSGFEYFLGMLLPNLLLMTGVQLLLIPMLEISCTLNNFILYGIISFLTVFISNVIGMCFGLVLKDQMSATLAPMPVIFFFWLMPMLANINETTKFIGTLVYSSLLPKVIKAVVYDTVTTFSMIEVGSFVLEMIMIIVIFLILYKKNGYENE